MSERYKNVAGIIQDGVNAAATEAMKEVQTEGIKYGYSEDPQRTIDQLRADNARKDAEIVRLKSEAEKAKQERNSEGVRQRNIYLPQLATYKAAVVEAREALEKCHKTFLTLERLGGYSTITPPNIVLQSVIRIVESLHTLSALTGDATKTP